MKPGDVVLIPLLQAGGASPKLRPALVLSLLPGPYQNLLICGISTQLREFQQDWDELLSSSDQDFVRSGIRRTSAVRLSYLYAADQIEIAGAIGQIDSDRLNRLRLRLSKLLQG